MRLILGNGSGDIALAFTTANRLPHEADQDLIEHRMLAESRIDRLFQATAEATQEAVLRTRSRRQRQWWAGTATGALAWRTCWLAPTLTMCAQGIRSSHDVHFLPATPILIGHQLDRMVDVDRMIGTWKDIL